ncbi:hypothetical protein PCASD_21163 [Puccinia coronata f. sp. avenae]|uniref:Tet-like 2OG-Fe(II) oxygenase domain-containing protein n=1 Tax=Puccinia coronata f. sp. avenae TaxID=200324 RepID=A0A2N5TQ53_9BASI|nr:hypothetical protein PCASD_21163 [Puccinia coronata f. sp. avenae]
MPLSFIREMAPPHPVCLTQVCDVFPLVPTTLRTWPTYFPGSPAAVLAFSSAIITPLYLSFNIRSLRGNHLPNCTLIATPYYSSYSQHRQLAWEPFTIIVLNCARKILLLHQSRRQSNLAPTQVSVPAFQGYNAAPAIMTDSDFSYYSLLIKKLTRRSSPHPTLHKLTPEPTKLAQPAALIRAKSLWAPVPSPLSLLHPAERHHPAEQHHPAERHQHHQHQVLRALPSDIDIILVDYAAVSSLLCMARLTYESAKSGRSDFGFSTKPTNLSRPQFPPCSRKTSLYRGNLRATQKEFQTHCETTVNLLLCTPRHARMGTKKRANNKSRKLSKQRNKSKKDKENRDQLIKQLKPTTSLAENKGVHVNWRDVKFSKLTLYPSIPLANKKPERKPTTAEIRTAYDKIESFHLFREGCNAVRDVKDNSIIALIEFIKFEDLTCQEKEDLNFFTTFFFQATKFINPVMSVTRSWGGLMWALGWRKSYDKDQIIGCYIKAFGPDDHIKFDELFKQSKRLGQVIGNHYKKTAEGPFVSNQQLMKQHHLPSFASLVYEEQLSDLDSAPHITFTTNSFFNPPHIDEEDISEYAFAMWVPTHSADGRLVCDPSTYDISSGTARKAGSDGCIRVYIGCDHLIQIWAPDHRVNC